MMTAMALSVFESFPLAWNVTEKRAIFTLPPDTFPHSRDKRISSGILPIIRRFIPTRVGQTHQRWGPFSVSLIHSHSRGTDIKISPKLG